MRYTALVLAAMLAACSTKQDRTEDSAAGRVPADSDVAAQGTGIPAGYTAITDDSSAKLTSIRYAANGANWEVTTGPAHIIFAPGDTASGNAGSVSVSAAQIGVTSGGQIASTTAGTGAGGSVTTPSA